MLQLLPELARLCGDPALQLQRCTFLRGRRGDDSVSSTRPGPGVGTQAASRHEDAQHRAEPCLEPAPPCRRRRRRHRIGRSWRRRAHARERTCARALARAPLASSACVCPSARCHSCGVDTQQQKLRFASPRRCSSSVAPRGVISRDHRKISAHAETGTKSLARCHPSLRRPRRRRSRAALRAIVGR